MAWVETLSDIVKSHWSSTGKAFLLSKAKAEMERRNVDLVSELDGRKLKDAVMEEGGSLLRLIRNPRQKLVWGVVPTIADTSGDLANLFSETESKPAISQSTRFGRGVWLAFAKPIKSGCRRYLEIGPPSKYFDVPEDRMPPPAGTEIDPEFIYNSTGELLPNGNHEAEVEANIRRWAQSRSIDIAKLAAPSHSLVGISRDSGNQFDRIDFSALSSAEKARILIPLDLLPKIKFGA